MPVSATHSAVKDHEATTPEVKTPATAPHSSPVSTGPKGSSGKFAGLGLGLLAVVVLGATTVLAAKSMGQGNQISQIFGSLPLEEVPILRQFAPAPLELLATGIMHELDAEYIKKLGGRDMASQMTVDLKGEVPQAKVPMTLHLDMASQVAMNGGMDQLRQTFSMGGNFKSGIFQVDVGKDGVKVDALQVSKNLAYFKVALSPQMMETVQPILAMQAQQSLASGEEPEFQLEDYLDKYLKFNLDEYLKMMTELASSSGEKITPPSAEKADAAVRKLMASLKPDVMKLAQSSGLAEMSKYITVNNHHRTTVNGKGAIEMELTVQSEPFATRFSAFIEGLPELIKNHRSDLIAYCEDSGSRMGSEETCEEMLSEESFRQMQQSFEEDPDSAYKMKDLFGRVAAAIQLSDVKVAVSPVDGTILRSSLTMSMTKDSIKPLEDLIAKESGVDSAQVQKEFQLDSLIIKTSAEEKSRGSFAPIDEPKGDVVDLTALIQKWINDQREKAQQAQLKATKSSKQIEMMQKQLDKNPQSEFDDSMFDF